MHRSRGCQAVFKLENILNHAELCHHAPLECAGCGDIVNRGELADHHVRYFVYNAVPSSFFQMILFNLKLHFKLHYAHFDCNWTIKFTDVLHMFDV